MSTEFARQLRASQTEVEKRLWAKLRDRQILGRKFRRQAEIGPYIVDFVSFEQQLIVELDGGQHSCSDEEDGRRTKWLEAQGFVVLRFWNNEVAENMEGVLQRVAEAISEKRSFESPLTPTLSHKGRGG
jgi:very-short-patch-repair endonuclease